jgi:hypothetical protein
LIDEQPDVVQQLTMSDEAQFELSGSVRRQNMRYWSDNNPCRLQGKPLHSERVTVWCGISAVSIIGPYFFKDENGRTVTVTSDPYVHMLTGFVFPALRNLGLDPATVYFQQAGATAHTTRQSINLLRTVLQHQIISHFEDINWPARSPDLLPCVFGDTLDS